jgi:hypothetical protein
MTDKKGFADRTRDHATDGDSPHANQAPERRRWTDVMKHFWPALVVPPVLILRSDSVLQPCARRRRR